LGLLGALAFTVLPAASAKAAGLIQTDACDNAALTQPFASQSDSNYYKLVPGGDFEGSLSGWSLTRGAKLVSGSEPFGATGKVGKYSMYLPAGASVQSPFTCVDAAYPMFRLFGRNNGLLSIALSGSWAPSAQMPTLSFVQGVLNALLTGKTPQVALRFTAVTGSSQIDDIYIDPHMAY
jgi:hypothetical protein